MKWPFRTVPAFLGFLLLLAVSSCSTDTPQAIPPADPLDLPKFLQVTPDILNGGRPAFPGGFDHLKRIGVKTIVSVESKRPDVAAATARGMRYVHMPMHYRGIEREQVLQIQRVLQDCEKPLYFHCRHGTTRSVAAAAIAKMLHEQLPGTDGVRVLERGGTSRVYAGLWRDVSRFTPPPTGTPLPELVAVATPTSMGESMAVMEEVFDRLRQCRDADWKAPEHNPDLSGTKEAELLAELLADLLKQESKQPDGGFTDRLHYSREQTLDLQRALQRRQFQKAEEHFSAIQQSCKDCHWRYRDR